MTLLFRPRYDGSSRVSVAREAVSEIHPLGQPDPVEMLIMTKSVER